MSKSRIVLITAFVFLIGIVVGGYLSVFVFHVGGAGINSGSAITGQSRQGKTGERKVLYWQAPMDPTEIYDHPGKSKMGMDLIPVYEDQKKPGKRERKILYWQAPMDPTEIYDHPGKSKMGMDLIPVYEDETTMGKGGTITIDPATVQNMGVRTARVVRSDFSHSIRTVGKVDYNEEKLFTVTTKISGWIEKLYVSYTGQQVRKGDPLLEIYSPELVSTQEEYLLALNTHDLVGKSNFASVRDGAESLLASTRKRLLYWDIPTSEIERLEKTGQVRKTLRLDSPADGVVIHKNAIEGMYVKEGQNLYQIADLSTVWVFVSVYDNEIPWVSVGQKAEMELSYLPGKTFTGRVTYIYPYLNTKARDVTVRLEFKNPNLELKPEMYANVRLEAATFQNVLTIPSEAIIRSGERNLVFVVREPGKFEPREIRIGPEGKGGKVHVLSGLFEGEEIVTSAQFMLDSESRLQEAIQKMLEERSKQQGQSGVGQKMKMGQARKMETYSSAEPAASSEVKMRAETGHSSAVAETGKREDHGLGNKM